MKHSFTVNYLNYYKLLYLNQTSLKLLLPIKLVINNEDTEE